MSDHDASIDGRLLRLHRETRGWTMTDMAMRSCLSIKQIRQLEEGGTDSFYSDSVKLTAAKKVGAVLGLSAAQVLGQPNQPLPVSAEAPLQPSLPEDQPHSPPASTQAVAQPLSDSGDTPKSTSTSVWVMGALFAAALLVAAWMNPRAEPVVPDAEPPLQTLPLPVEAPESASSMAGVASEAAEAASR
jgi:transcriptional regulator with XRE-family HTH domain